MQNNKSVRLRNLRMLEFVATKLEEIRNDVVFLGGCTTGLFITDTKFPDVRYTLDVDCIVDVISLNQYHQLEKKLTKQGFKRSLSEEIICRWFYDDVTLDVMPTDEKILGFGNRWYKKAIAASIVHHLTDKIDKEKIKKLILSQLNRLLVKQKEFSKLEEIIAEVKSDENNNNLPYISKLVWGKLMTECYELSKIAIAMLSICPTESSVERSFSILSNIHTLERNNLHEDIIDAELSIKINLKN